MTKTLVIFSVQNSGILARIFDTDMTRYDDIIINCYYEKDSEEYKKEKELLHNNMIYDDEGSFVHEWKSGTEASEVIASKDYDKVAIIYELL
jgi:predicted transcriptional regulator